MDENCGTIDSPCRHVKDAVQKSNINAAIMIDGTFWGEPAPYTEEDIIVSKAVKLIGYNGQPTLQYEGKNSSFFKIKTDGNVGMTGGKVVHIENIKFITQQNRKCNLNCNL